MQEKQEVGMAEQHQHLGLFDSIKNLMASLVSHLHTRLALFSNELKEEKIRMTAVLIGAVLTLFFAFMALIFISVFIVAAWWDSPYRLHIIGGLAALFLVAAAIAGGIVRARLVSGPRPFAISLAELYKDRQALDSK